MPTPEIIALADQVRTHLDRGDLAGLGPIELVPDGGVVPDAEIAARIVLADVAHCLQLERESNLPWSASSWAGLATQLRCFERVLHGRVAAREAHQGDLTAQMPAILWSTDAELRLTSATGMGLVEVGRGPALGGAGPLARLLGVDEPDSPPRAAHRRALQGETAAYECDWRGLVFWAHLRPLRGPGGAIVGVVGVALDITEARQADSAQESGEERFRLALRGSPVIVYRQDTDLRHTWIYNPQHGFSPAAVLGKTDAELIRPEEAAIQAVIKGRVLETGVGAREVVRVTVGGEAAYYDLTIEPLRGSTGEIVGITGAATNVTTLKRTEEALARREAQLAEAQRIAHVGSWEWDIPAAKVWWSEEQYRIFGLDPQTSPVALEAATAGIHPEDVARTQALIDAALRTREPFDHHLRVVRPDGEVRTIHSRGTVLRDAAGRPKRMIGTAQDVTERLRADEERMMQREREARLAGMLFAARGLAARMNDALVLTTEALDGVRPQPTLTPALRQAIDTAAAGLFSVQGDLAELQRLIPPPAQGFGGPDPV